MAENTSDKCRHCKGELNSGAVYCLHCKTFQNWRRHISFSSTVLALLVALVSVVGTATPMVIDALQRQYSQATFSVLDCDETDFAILAVNQGNRRAVISTVNLWLEFGTHPFTVDSGDRVLTAEGAREITLKLTQKGDLAYLLEHEFWGGSSETGHRDMRNEKGEPVDFSDTGKARLDIEVIEFDGSKKIYNVPIAKRTFERFLVQMFPERSRPDIRIVYQPREAD